MASSTTLSPLHCLCLTFCLLLARSVAIPPPSSSPSTGGSHDQPSSAAYIYIVYADHVAKPSNFTTLEHWYTSMVASVSPAGGSTRFLYVYDTVMHGFAAELTAGEARRLSNTPGVTGVSRDRAVRLHTTRSPAFLGLDERSGVWPDTGFGDGVIIGFVDSGIWPESDSFSDAGLGPVRPTWKGRCVGGERFDATMCNNKLVGARTFTNAGAGAGGTLTSTEARDFASPRDKAGHGTHVASTAAGSGVPGASLFEFASGTARGVAPRARVAMYKACSPAGICSLSDIAAAIDAAVRDGVDILSLSLGGDHDGEFYDEPVSVALFGAVRAGVFVACSAGNAGPRASSLSNVAPWITTVGAGTLDRVFPASVTLGNGQVLTGQSLYPVPANGTDFVRLLQPGSCTATDLVPDRIMGKIVVCADGPSLNGAVRKAGGAGLVTVSADEWRVDGVEAFPFTLPGVSLGARDADALAAYVRSEPYPVASFRFECRTVTGENPAPVVAAYSSRGPNHVAREILKPDVIAPGTNILAAWPGESPLTGTNTDAEDEDPRRARFNIVSGTSMSCPHVAGVAALLKRRHPGWSPAMIRSAMVTTATTLDSRGAPIEDNGGGGGAFATPFAAGAGLVRPQQALDPGLVYDAGERDYVGFLCALNYTAAQVRVFVPGFAGCASTAAAALPGGAGGLNYPSFVADLSNGTGDVRALTRTVTKVSEGPETYAVKVVAAPRRLVEVTVTPATLEFGGEPYERKSYTVVFRRTPGARAAAATVWFGQIVWESDVHSVRSPVVYMFN